VERLAVALVTILAAHTVLTLARFAPGVAFLTDHRVRILVDCGQLRRSQLRISGLTVDDLTAQLREKGVGSLDELPYVLYEAKGQLTIVRESAGPRADSDLVATAVRSSAPRRSP